MHSFYYRPLSLRLLRVSAASLCLLRHMHSVTTTTTTNITAVESNPSRHILILHRRSHTHTHTFTHTSLQQLPVKSHLQSTCACPTLQSTQTVHQVQKILSAFSFFFLVCLSLPPSASLTNLPLPHSVPLFPRLALQRHMRRKLFLFNSLQQPPINSFTDGRSGPAGAS